MDDREITAEHKRYINIPARYWNVGIEQLNDEFARQVAIIPQLLQSGKVIVVLGEDVEGGSSIGAVCALEAFRAHSTAYMIQLNDLMVRKDDNFDDGITVYERCRRVDLLVLDGIIIPMDEWKEKLFRSVMRYRFDWKKPTVLVFNVPLTIDVNQTIVNIRATISADIQQVVFDNVAEVLAVTK